MMQIKMNNKGQEEMIGFALIMIIVAVVLLVFLSISLSDNEKEGVESYEVESFIQSFLQYTSTCEENYESNYMPIRNLIFECNDGRDCYDGRESCVVLNETLKNIIEENWQYGENVPVKGYELEILSEDGEILLLSGGNETRSYKGGSQSYSKSGEGIDIIFSVYYE